MAQEQLTHPGPAAPRAPEGDVESPDASGLPSHPGPESSASSRKRWYHVPYVSAVGAVLFAASSLTPSLLPRSAMVQGIVTGVAGALGYAMGLALAGLVRQFTGRSGPWPGNRRAWQVLAAVGVLLLGLMLALGKGWQDQLHEFVSRPTPGLAWYPSVVGFAALVFGALIAISRAVRHLARGLGRLLGRFIPPRTARAIGIIVAGVATIAVVQGVLLDGAYTVMNQTFRLGNDQTTQGVVQPGSQLVSGSADSQIQWSDLGVKGRDFISAVPTLAQLEEFSGQPATEPIRVYAGLGSSDDAAKRAELVVADLKRFGAFERKVLLVANSTGSGWVDPTGVTPLEYMYNGDSAIVATQYSYLPSWLSFLADQAVARQAARDLFDAVYAEWAQLPVNDRPKLLMFGESLGSFGGEAAFSGIHDMVNRTDGILFAGPPNANPLHTQFTQAREPGSPEVLPIFHGGENLRFAEVAGNLAKPATAWSQPRLVYLQNASDPVVWWSPKLLLARPDWLSEQRAPGVSPAMRWAPLVTFFQLTADMMDSTSVPYGHGHVYGPNQTPVWALIAEPPGWSAADTQRLSALMGQ